MRGPDEQTADIFSYVSPETRVRADHPLRAIRQMTDQVLRELSPRFERMYSDLGRPSIPPEQLRALLLDRDLHGRGLQPGPTAHTAAEGLNTMAGRRSAAYTEVCRRE